MKEHTLAVQNYFQKSFDRATIKHKCIADEKQGKS